jgi:transcriptional regulator NrdR family protein
LSSLVVKRGGEDQPFDERKLYASIFISLRIANESEKKAEIIAGEVVTLLKRWLEEKTHVTSRDIRNHAAHQLKEYNQVAAYVYTHHRTLS